MKPEVKTKWLAALRSGEYKQGTAALRKDNEFCCLGVLCDLHAKETGNKWESVTFAVGRAYLGDTGLLPRQVETWAGIARSPMIGGDNLAVLNDEGMEFSALADLIEKQL